MGSEDRLRWEYEVLAGAIVGVLLVALERCRRKEVDARELVRVRLELEAAVSDLDATRLDLLAQTVVDDGWVTGLRLAEEKTAGGFSPADKAMLLASGVLAGLRAENVRLLANVRASVVSQALRLYRQAVLQIQTSSLGFDARVDDAKKLVSRTGAVGFVDKSGRRWGVPMYAGMVAGTLYANAVRGAVVESLPATGLSFLIVDGDGGCPECAPWCGVVLVAEGDVVPPATARLSDAEASGLFHPNCRHLIVPFDPDKVDMGSSSA